LLTAMANNSKKKEKVGNDCGCSGGGGSGGNGNGHGTDEKSQSSNNIPPAISQIDIEGTLHANEDNEFDVSLDAANCNNDFYDQMTVTGGTDNNAKEEKIWRQKILEQERATKLRDARKRYFERNESWEGATLSLLALEGIDSLMKRGGGMGRGGGKEVGKEEDKTPRVVQSQDF